MAELVIHRLEPVEIDEHDSPSHSVVPPVDHLVDEFDGRRSVEARRQLVDGRPDFEFLMQAGTISHVTQASDGPADLARNVGEWAQD